MFKYRERGSMWFGPLNMGTRAESKPWLIKQDLNLEPRRCFCLFTIKSPHHCLVLT